MVDPHILFPMGLQTHASTLELSKRQLERRQADFELNLKASALLTRGIVVTDSDLNNNHLFHGLLGKDRTLQTAIEVGFVRRAVRAGEDDAPWSQQLVAEQLAGASRERFAKIPEGHVTALDDALERSSATPVLWRLTEMGETFALRVLALLQEQVLAAGHGTLTAQRGLFMMRGIATRWKGERSLPAAWVEREFRPSGTSSEDLATWKSLWSAVLGAYNGNVPVKVGLTTSDSISDPARFLPTGPESSASETEIELDLYEGSVERLRQRYVMHSREQQLPDVLSQLEFDSQRLAAADIRDLIELRETSQPDAFLDLGFRTLGSAEALSTSLDEFVDTAAAYAQRLMREAESTMRRRARVDILRRMKATDDGQAGHSRLRTYFLSTTGLERERLLDQMVACVTDCQFVSNRVAVCDLNRLAKLRPDLATSSRRAGLVTNFSVQRPDLKVIARIGAELVEEYASAEG